MNSLLLATICIVAFLISYWLYARFLSEKILCLDKSRPTPAHTMRDGVDYVPSRKVVLFGHHFASIAGLGPIMGPAIAVIWGWLPAILWVVLGSIFLGAVHDFSTLFVSIRRRGRSIGDVAEELVGSRGRFLFMIVIFFLLALAMGAFATIIATLFTTGGGGERMYPEAVIPVVSLILIAVFIGYLVYRKKASLMWSSIVGLALMFFALWLGIEHPFPIISHDLWVVILLGYAFVASVLPVWLLLQPRDYLNSYLLYLGMVGLYIGLIYYHPPMIAPPLNQRALDLPGLFPFLFITIACGAISGFHSLVSSGTTAKQLYNEGDAKFIGYGGMLTEGFLAVLVIIACTAGVSSLSLWYQHYSSWEAAGSLSFMLRAFVTGAGRFFPKLGYSEQYAVVLISVIIVSFAMTTLDSATRLLRYNIEELGRSFRLKPLQNRYCSSLVAVAAIGYFALMKIGGEPAGLVLWQLFGTTNQLLAGLALLAVSIFLYKSKKPTYYTFIPMVFMLVVAITAMVIKLGDFWKAKESPPLVIGSIILILAGWLLVEAILVYIRMFKKKKEYSSEREGRL